MDMASTVHNVPVEARHLPLVYRVLADAYEGESLSQADGGDPSDQPPAEGRSATEWTREEVLRAYHESTPKQRVALDYLADRPEQSVRSLKLALEVYPDDDGDDAESRLYGVLGAFGTRAKYTYGKDVWFFSAERERHSDGSMGYMVYTMPAEEAAWLREAGGRPDPE